MFKSNPQMSSSMPYVPDTPPQTGGVYPKPWQPNPSTERAPDPWGRTPFQTGGVMPVTPNQPPIIDPPPPTTPGWPGLGPGIAGFEPWLQGNGGRDPFFHGDGPGIFGFEPWLQGGRNPVAPIGRRGVGYPGFGGGYPGFGGGSSMMPQPSYQQYLPQIMQMLMMMRGGFDQQPSYPPDVAFPSQLRGGYRPY